MDFRDRYGFDEEYDLKFTDIQEVDDEQEDSSAKKRKSPRGFLAGLIAVIMVILLIYTFLGADSVTATIRDLLVKDDFATLETLSAGESDGVFTGQEDVSQTVPAPSSISETSVIPFYSIRYELLNLNEPLLKNFCALYSAVQGFEDECRFPCDMNPDDINLLCELINTECPELFHFDSGKVSYKSTTITKNVVSASLTYTMTPDEYRDNLNICNDIVSSLCSETQDMTDYEKEMRVYRYLTENCFFNDTAENSGNMYGALVEHNARCEGISKAVKWILENMNIMCLCPMGRSPENEEGHMWNIVRLNGAFYDIDVTADTKNEKQDSPMLYGAVNVSDSWIRDRYNLIGHAASRMAIPGSSVMDQSFHALNGSLVHSGESYETLVYSSLHDIYTHGGGSFYIQFEDPDTFSSFIDCACSSDTLSSWFAEAGCRSRSFSSKVNYSKDYRTCCLSFTFK